MSVPHPGVESSQAALAGIARYLRERDALAAREGDLVEVTAFGDPAPRFIDQSPDPWDYARVAEGAYLRGDLTVEEFERVLDDELGLVSGIDTWSRRRVKRW